MLEKNLELDNYKKLLEIYKLEEELHIPHRYGIDILVEENTVVYVYNVEDEFVL